MDKDDHKIDPEKITLAEPSSSALEIIRDLGPSFHAPGIVRGAVLGGRYEILELLGEGGMGAVYNARDRELDRAIALKVIRPELADNAAVVQRFKQELILARGVTHKNVIRIYDFGEAQGTRFITMEYVDGEDLGHILRNTPKLPPEQAIEIMAQVCAGLEAAHAEGVVHRDLKPSNIMREANGRVVVMDFGLARSTGSDRMTRTGALLGTIEYMSPEQAMGKPLDARSDLYTFGLILYEMLTGRMPYAADSGLASLVKRTQERAAPPDALDSSIPRRLSALVAKCLEPDPNRRYQSASEILEELNAIRGCPPQRSSAVRFPRIRSYKKIAVTAAAVVLLAVIGAIIVKVRPHKSATAHAEVTVLVSDFDNKTGDAVFDGTLEPSFTLALEGANFITSFSRRQARKVAAQLQPGATAIDEKLARLVAVREGINVVIVGAIERAGSGLRVSIAAEDAFTGKQISSRNIDVAGKEAVLPAVAKLAGGIRASLGDTTPESVQLAAAETFTSGSLEAAHHYALGQDLGWAGKFEEAIREYSQAAQLDPNLGRAYAGMAVCYINLGQRQQSEKYFQLAMARIDRMTEREKYRTRGGYYLIVRDADKAVEEFTALVKQYPSDSVGFANLAYAYFYKRDMARALQEGRRAVALNPKNVPQRNNIGLYAMYAGDFDTAIREQRDVIKLNPSFALAYVGLALAQLAQGNVPESRDTWQQLQQLGPHGASFAAIGLADLALYQGRASDAKPLLEAGMATDIAGKDDDAAAHKAIMLAEAYLWNGDSRRAQQVAARAVALSDDDSVRFGAARVFAETGQPKKALALSAVLSQRVSADAQMLAKLIEGELELKRHNANAAMAKFKEAQKLADAWLVHFDLGLAYLDAGAFTEADSEFEICLRRRGEATAAFLDESPTEHLIPAVYYYLGRAQEGLNSPSAAQSFKTFLEMRSGGEDPLVADARLRTK